MSIQKFFFSFSLAALLCGCSDQANKTSDPSTDTRTYHQDICQNQSVALTPLFHNPPDAPDPYLSGLNIPEKIIEKDAFACRRLVATKNTITVKRVSSFQAIQGPCNLSSELYYTVAQKNLTTNFVWTGPVDFVSSGEEMNVLIQPGEAFYACLKLPIQDAEHRACTLSCESGPDENSFWSDTDPVTGLVKNPIVLEPLSLSPTEEYAAMWGNQNRRVGIDFEWLE